MTDWKYMKPSEVFAERLRQTRDRHQLSQTQLAQLATDEGRELDRAAVLRIESGKRRLSLDEAVALTAVLSAVPAQMLTPPEGVLVALTDERGTDGEGLRNWFNYGQAVLGLPTVGDSGEVRTDAEGMALLRGLLESDLTRHALALADAVKGEDKAGVKVAGAAIVAAVRAYQNAVEADRG